MHCGLIVPHVELDRLSGADREDFRPGSSFAEGNLVWIWAKGEMDQLPVSANLADQFESFPIDKLRAICLGLPEVAETGGVGDPSFKVREKIFAMQHQMQGRPSLWVKAPAGLQEALIESEPERYFCPPYVGHHGWVGTWLDVEVDWKDVTDMIHDSYCMTAPKRLAGSISRIH